MRATRRSDHIEGEFLTFGVWSLEAADGIGRLLRRLHDATSTFKAPDRRRVAARGSAARCATPSAALATAARRPWNIVVQEGHAGGADRLGARRAGRPAGGAGAGVLATTPSSTTTSWPSAKGCRSGRSAVAILHTIVDGYGLSQAQRRGFIDLILEVAVRATADEADQVKVRARHEV